MAYKCTVYKNGGVCPTHARPEDKCGWHCGAKGCRTHQDSEQKCPGWQMAPINGSVGHGGTNRYEDVRVVQGALNRFPKGVGGPNPRLDTDGKVGTRTIEAIRKFQQIVVQSIAPDGKVDPPKPHGTPRPTLAKLIVGPVGGTGGPGPEGAFTTPLRIWINAFIPLEIAGYTQVIRTGTHAGKTAVPLPGLARVNPMNLPKNWDTGYLTDQRDFNESPLASVRMQSLVEIQLTPRVSVIRSHHITSGTTEVDMVTGKELGSDEAKMNRCRFYPLSLMPPVRVGEYRTFPLGVPFSLASPAAGVPTYELRVLGQANDPLVSLASDIDYEGAFEVTVHAAPVRCFVAFKGLIDAFPAFECYAQLGGRTKTLFTARPPSGNTVTNLPGTANRPIMGMVSFP